MTEHVYLFVEFIIALSKVGKLMSPISKKIVNFKAEFSCDSFYCDGFIDNISEDNICCTTTARNLCPGFKCLVKFQPESGEALNLNCMLAWSYKTPPCSHAPFIYNSILYQASSWLSGGNLYSYLCDMSYYGGFSCIVLICCSMYMFF